MKINISFTDFVDFSLTNGTQRLSKVKEIKRRGDYHPATDYWKDFRDAVVTMHRENKDIRYLYNVAESQKQESKKMNYKRHIENYHKFLGRKEIVWFHPPKSKWNYEDLVVTINPELGLYINGKPHIIKMFLKDGEVSKRKAEALFFVMKSEFEEDFPETTFGLLELKKSKLHVPTKEPENISVLLRAEATAFLEIYHNL
jgi:hypothetical protein